MKSITRLTACAAALLGAMLVTAQVRAVEYSGVDLAHSKLLFSYSEMGVKLDGSFAKFTVQLNFDPAKPQLGHTVMDVAMASVDAGSAEATSEVAGKEWFDTAHFPSAHFESTSIALVSAGVYKLSGNLTIKGHTHPVAFNVTLTSAAGQNLLQGAFSFNRTDYSVGEGDWADTSIVANPIQIQCKLALTAAH